MFTQLLPDRNLQALKIVVAIALADRSFGLRVVPEKPARTKKNIDRTVRLLGYKRAQPAKRGNNHGFAAT